MTEYSQEPEPTLNEPLTPVQVVMGEIMDLVHGGVDRWNIAELALCLRYNGLTANTIRSVIDAGKQIFKDEKPSGTTAILELCADNNDPFKDISVLSRDEIDIGSELYRSVQKAFPYFPRQVVDALRLREEEFGLDIFPEDSLGEVAGKVYEGKIDIEQIEQRDPNVWDLVYDLYVVHDNYGGFSWGNSDYSRLVKAKALIETAKSLQLD